VKNHSLMLLLTAAPLFAGAPAPLAPEVPALRPFQSDGNSSNCESNDTGRAGLALALNFRF